MLRERHRVPLPTRIRSILIRCTAGVFIRRMRLSIFLTLWYTVGTLWV